MQMRIRVGPRAEHAGWAVVKLFALILVVSSLVSSSSRDWLRRAPQPGPKTVLPALIRAARMEAITVPFSARVARVLVAPGSKVKNGELLAVLESEEVNERIVSARRRVAICATRAGADPQSSIEANGLRSRSAEASLAAAQRRMAEYSSSATEAAYSRATERRQKIAALVRDHMATSAELDAAGHEEQNWLRNLRAEHDQQSRLSEELRTAEVQAALVRTEIAAPHPERTAARIELAEAQEALRSALRQQSELEVRAPRDGIVLSSVPAGGDRVFVGSPVFHLADTSQLSFEAAVSAKLAGEIHPGDAVRLRIPTDPPRYASAKISTVALAPDPTQQSYIVRAVTPNPEPSSVLVGLEGAIEFPHRERTWRRPF